MRDRDRDVKSLYVCIAVWVCIAYCSEPYLRIAPQNDWHHECTPQTDANPEIYKNLYTTMQTLRVPRVGANRYESLKYSGHLILKYGSEL